MKDPDRDTDRDLTRDTPHTLIPCQKQEDSDSIDSFVSLFVSKL